MERLRSFWLTNGFFSTVLDIFILAFLIYQIYKLLVQTKAMQLVKGAAFLLVLYVLAFFFNLKTLLWLLTNFATMLIIAVAVIFQPELRAILVRLGQKDWLKFSSATKQVQFDSVLNAVEMLAEKRRGALIVFARNIGLKSIIETGTRLDAVLSSSLLLTIFGHDTTLHDGAVVVQGGLLAAAGCFLPLSEQTDIRKSFGTRHRAALGMAEQSDALILVVSEETGAISLAYNSNLRYDMTRMEIIRSFRELLNLQKGDVSGAVQK
ncbi:MAG: diadenylate cyclase CdaA [Spirochaetales bacterium]|jgi:diadenylate cyclase|nr:diadenylate cyclase CdaA [Spirochaetales bacterium]